MEDRILYRDGMVLILDKPAGMPVHPGPKGGETLEDHLDSLRFGWAKRPELAHRLDRDTSGCLVLGRHPKALRKLGKLFADGKVEKRYWTIAVGHPPQDSGTIDLPLAKRSTEKRGWWVKVDKEQGKEALTLYKTLGKSETHSWLELEPRTGRTHQIRVHLAAIGCPILGDAIYGNAAETPLCLLSRSISFSLSAEKPPISAIAEPPEHMQLFLKACGWIG